MPLLAPAGARAHGRLESPGSIVWRNGWRTATCHAFGAEANLVRDVDFCSAQPPCADLRQRPARCIISALYRHNGICYYYYVINCELRRFF